MAQGKSLEGVLVVALEQAVAAPLCTAQLARSGARVIKVERPEGDFARNYDSVVHGESAYFVWLNAGKQSICIDLREKGDRDLLHRIVGRADIFVQNMAPGAAARHGFGSEELRAASPRLITLDISGYGDTGPYRDMKAYDLLIQAESGIAWTTGTPDEPGRVGVSICDIACGMYAYGAILDALLLRERSGEGSALRLSLFDAAANWMTVPLLHQEYGGRPPARLGLRHPSIAPYGVFKTSDGRDILIAVQNEREWEALCVALNCPALSAAPHYASNELRVANRATLDASIGEMIAALAASDLYERLRRNRIAFGELNDLQGLSEHPQLRREWIGSPSGPVKLVGHPVIRTGMAEWHAASPALGAQGAEIRREFGL